MSLKHLFSILFLCASLSGFAQKVKFKKDKALVDDVEMYKVDRDGNMMTVATISDVEFISTVSTSYQEKNPARYNGNNPNAYRLPEFLTKWVVTLKFLKSGNELFTDLSEKDIIKAIYKSKIVDDEGVIDEEKMNIFINKYNNDNLKYKL